MQSIKQIDPVIASLIHKEAQRQSSALRMIPSENYASLAVMTATGSCLTNKYSEGYPAARYYQGQEYVDQVELIAIERVKRFFGAEHANVQPYSGSPANMAIYLATMKPGECSMGMDLASGGHLTHGAKVSFSGKIYDVKNLWS